MRRLILPIAAAVLTAAMSVARAGDEQLTLEELDKKERELQEEMFRDSTGRRSRFAAEVELGTQVDWVNRDQHGTLHGGFSFSFSPQEVENLRVASFYAGIAVGQIGDEAHRYVHLETGYRPNFELPIDSEFKPFLGARHLVAMSSIGGDDGVDGTLANGASFGVRALGGLLSLEVHGDAVFSWNREFLVDGERTHWVPRFGFNVKSDMCAFAGGDRCEYPAPTPEDVDLSALMDEALVDLTTLLSPPPAKQCTDANLAVTLQIENVYPVCGPADAEGFFCRFKAAAKGAEKADNEDARLIELARVVHGELQACYNQGRIDERTAALKNTMLQRKLRYGAYPPELRSAVCRGKEPAFSEEAEAKRCDKVERARYSCPRAAQARDVLRARVREREKQKQKQK